MISGTNITGLSDGLCVSCFSGGYQHQLGSAAARAQITTRTTTKNTASTILKTDITQTPAWTAMSTELGTLEPSSPPSIEVTIHSPKAESLRSEETGVEPKEAFEPASKSEHQPNIPKDNKDQDPETRTYEEENNPETHGKEKENGDTEEKYTALTKVELEVPMQHDTKVDKDNTEPSTPVDAEPANRAKNHEEADVSGEDMPHGDEITMASPSPVSTMPEQMSSSTPVDEIGTNIAIKTTDSSSEEVFGASVEMKTDIDINGEEAANVVELHAPCDEESSCQEQITNLTEEGSGAPLVDLAQTDTIIELFDNTPEKPVATLAVEPENCEDSKKEANILEQQMPIEDKDSPPTTSIIATSELTPITLVLAEDDRELISNVLDNTSQQEFSTPCEPAAEIFDKDPNFTTVNGTSLHEVELHRYDSPETERDALEQDPNTQLALELEALAINEQGVGPTEVELSIPFEIELEETVANAQQGHLVNESSSTPPAAEYEESSFDEQSFTSANQGISTPPEVFSTPRVSPAAAIELPVSPTTGRPIYGPAPESYSPISIGSGYDTDTAGYEPRSPETPQRTDSSVTLDHEVLEDENGQRVEIYSCRSESTEELERTEATESRGNRNITYNTSTRSPPSRPYFETQRAFRNEIAYCFPKKGWKPRMGPLYSLEDIGDDRFHNLATVNFFLGGTGEDYNMLVYDKAPCTMINEKWYYSQVVGRKIPWVFGSKLEFGGQRYSINRKHNRADFHCTVPLLPLKMMDYNPYRFLTGENFFSHFGVRGIGMVPAIIGSVPFLIVGLIVNKLVPCAQQPQIEDSFAMLLGPDFQEIFGDFLKPSGDPRDGLLYMPTAPPALNLLHFEGDDPTKILKQCELRIGLHCERAAQGEQGGVGVYFGKNSVFNSALPFPAIHSNQNPFTQELYSAIYGIGLAESVLYRHGYRSGITSIALYTASSTLIRAVNDPTLFRKLLAEAPSAQVDELCKGWESLLLSMARIRESLGLEFFWVDSSSPDDTLNGKGAEMLAEVGRRIKKVMYPTRSGAGKSIPVGLSRNDDAVHKLCALPYDLGSSEDDDEVDYSDQANYLITEVDYLRFGLIPGWDHRFQEVIEDSETNMEL